MRIGFLGLGKMGQRMVRKLLEDGHEVVVWNRSHETSLEFEKEVKNVILASKARPGSDSGKVLRQAQDKNDSEQSRTARMTVVKNISDFATELKPPRIFWSMVLFGEPTEEVLSQLEKVVQPGDVIVDGANSFYEDTQRRSVEMSSVGIEFLGIGVSGGILAPENGFPLMVGGSKIGYEKIKPILDSLSKPHGGHTYLGSGGAGHFVKMVHNAIEYGMMQAIGEGFGVLDKSPYELNLEDVADLWTKETIVSSFLMDRAKDALQKDAKLDKTIGFIEENGEARWTIDIAKKLQVPIQVTEDSLEFRLKSQKDLNIQKTFAARMVAALRHEFGGHKVKEK